LLFFSLLFHPLRPASLLPDSVIAGDSYWRYMNSFATGLILRLVIYSLKRTLTILVLGSQVSSGKVRLFWTGSVKEDNYSHSLQLSRRNDKASCHLWPAAVLLGAWLY
jgi:hypothetical protein